MLGTRRFGDLRAPEVAARLTPSSVLVQPVAAIEQHGPHLPLDVDLICPTEIARGAGRQVP
ncbi:MAG TPA: creatininase family protein, partial [Acidimicrobiales bacterium]|nr:creatininase family protein [Acidimicrobiales bacterium]